MATADGLSTTVREVEVLAEPPAPNEIMRATERPRAVNFRQLARELGQDRPAAERMAVANALIATADRIVTGHVGSPEELDLELDDQTSAALGIAAEPWGPILEKFAAAMVREGGQNLSKAHNILYEAAAGLRGR